MSGEGGYSPGGGPEFSFPVAPETLLSSFRRRLLHPVFGIDSENWGFGSPFTDPGRALTESSVSFFFTNFPAIRGEKPSRALNAPSRRRCNWASSQLLSCALTSASCANSASSLVCASSSTVWHLKPYPAVVDLSLMPIGTSAASRPGPAQPCWSCVSGLAWPPSPRPGPAP